jgi:Rrf2 family nitric oxide-sensitive transcriptional repressor
MQLTTQTDYALRTLVFVAVHPENCTIGDVADRYRISRNHVVVVVHRLGKLGFLRNTRGKGGGLRLAEPIETITVGAVVRAFEPLTLADCFQPDNGRCVINGPCRLTAAFQQALAAWLKVLDRTTLADLTAGNRKLVRLLRKPA